MKKVEINKNKLGKELRRLNRLFNANVWRMTSGNKPKIFGIGRNKTGTTSLKSLMRDLGYRIGNQKATQIMLESYKKRAFNDFKILVKQGSFFQDGPFSYPYSFIAFDQLFPGSKFILTIRDSPEQWYYSNLEFYKKTYAEGRIPTVNDLKECDIMYKGWAYNYIKYVFDTSDDDLFNKSKFIESYIRHNECVQAYFKHRPDDLIIINVAIEEDYYRLCDFLGKKPLSNCFPKINVTKEI